MTTHKTQPHVASLCGLLLALLLTAPCAAQWKRHTIDDSSRGADGVRLADVNGDSRPDVVCGWEEGGVIRAYLNPGPEAVGQPWPQVTVGRVASPEDAVFADLDRDGAVDVVSCTEGRTRTVFVHWAPPDQGDYLDGQRWATAAIPCTENQQQWMYAVPMQLDGQAGVDLVVGSKGQQASVGWLRSPPAGDPRDLGGWTFQRLYDAGWIMSIEPADLDDDGDHDLLISDRKGPRRGVLWLENPGAEACRRGASWAEHRLAGDGLEVMFLTLADLDGDGGREVITATRNGKILVSRPADDVRQKWTTLEIPNPFGVPFGKSVAAADLDGDGLLDLAHTCNNGGRREHLGATWLRQTAAGRWQPHDLGGRAGVKFDLIQPLDLDADGDLDLITCEERDNLGVFWYENPR